MGFLTFKQSRQKLDIIFINCILFPKLFWPTVRKNVALFEKKLLGIRGWRLRIWKFFLSVACNNLFKQLKVRKLEKNNWVVKAFRKKFKKTLTPCTLERVFCFQNCSDLQREKIVLVIKKSFWNSRLKVKNLQIFWDH